MSTEAVGVQAMPAGRSKGEKPKVRDRRYLRPAEVHRLIEAAGKRGRYPFRDKVLLRLVYRHGLRVSEATNMRWSQVDLEAGVLHVARVKGSKDSTHSLDRDELKDLRKLRQQVTGLYVFETATQQRCPAIHRARGGHAGQSGRCGPPTHATACGGLHAGKPRH